MPKPRKGEKRGDYIARAVRTIKQEEPGKPIKEVLGKAYGMWTQYSGGKK
jgi:hypothetical protein